MVVLDYIVLWRGTVVIKGVIVIAAVNEYVRLISSSTVVRGNCCCVIGFVRVCPPPPHTRPHLRPPSITDVQTRYRGMKCVVMICMWSILTEGRLVKKIFVVLLPVSKITRRQIKFAFSPYVIILCG